MLYEVITVKAKDETPAPTKKFYTAGFVLGILSICIPFYGIILGIIGLCLSAVSKRKSAIILNIIGLAFWILIILCLVAYGDSEDEYYKMENTTEIVSVVF